MADLERRDCLPEFMRAWEHFMAEFGMRCPGEIDPATPRPKEQPALLFEQLKNMALAIKTGTHPGLVFRGGAVPNARLLTRPCMRSH